MKLFYIEIYDLLCAKVELYILSGFISQILYLRTTSINLSSSGIGAYFDDITKEFFETSNNIFYVFAIGK